MIIIVIFLLSMFFFENKTYSFISKINIKNIRYNNNNKYHLFPSRELRKVSSFVLDNKVLYNKQKIRKRKFNFFYVFSNKMSDINNIKEQKENDECGSVEELIEKYSCEISSLIERNQCIKEMNDEELKKEYMENEKLLQEKKMKLKDLYSKPSEELKLIENRTKLENLVKRKFFYTNSFEIYGGASGLFDYGPSGCLLKSELENLWRCHFIYYDEMLEISGSCVTPYQVLKTSGHVDRFTDLMIRDVVTNDCYRADKYLGDFLRAKIEELRKKNTKEDEHVEEKEKKQKRVDDINHKNNNDDNNINNINNINNCNTFGGGENDTEVLIQKIELILRKLDGMNQDEIKEIIKEYNIKSPLKNDLSDPFPFNLMFQTKIGPKDDNTEDKNKEKCKNVDDNKNLNNTNTNNNNNNNMNNIAFLRPETAQGIFVNFKKLLEYNGGKTPFAGAQLGLGFRNEISPRNGLLRVREFQMAEIEYFVNPKKKNHEKYDLFKYLMLPLYPRDNQLTDGMIIKNMTLEEAVEKKIIANEALAYFLARTYLFLLKCGINKDGIRFRQHLKTEMAHYANDCWDAEILTSFGFIEVVGHADRSAYDLQHHMKYTGANLYACEKYNEPIEMEFVKMIPNKAKIGHTFKSDQNKIYSCLNEKTNEELLLIDEELNKNNKYILNVVNNDSTDNEYKFELTRDMLSFQKYKKKVQEENFIPNVIEPSFGIGRLIFCILEHSFRIRKFTDDKEERQYLSLPYKLAPIKCSILSISNNKAFYPYIKQIQMLLNQYNISSKIDNSSVSIGKKYARTDEIGIPFAVTIDFQTLKDKTITLRERDSMLQIRISMSHLVDIINSMLHAKKYWNEYISQYGLFTQQVLDS
ncbi:glycine--tRNA ligase [Plasmodium gaboni]|uniref:glycine--tRNA ligase n=1 Tax=Plasmodium gaboni TaxID=647221 RepID=A0A151LA35_9APIC|nr:glycine--tRNA ligase [Plasmodium gaboni]KYN95811.1 glycine--tRNA ligase [Plasmodium gaboni]